MKRTLVLPLLLLVLLVGACGGGDDEANSDESTTTSAVDTTTTEAPTDDTGPDTTTTGDSDSDDADDSARSDEFPCDLISTAEVSELVGADLDEGERRPTTNSTNDDEWSSQKCEWQGGNEVSIDVALPDGFDSGVVLCPEPVSDPVEITGPGETVWWSWEALINQAELQVCTPEVLVEIEIDTWDEGDEAGAQAALLGLAETVMAGL